MAKEKTILHCPACNGIHIIKAGFTEDKHKQRYLCKECGKKQIADKEKSITDVIKFSTIKLYHQIKSFRKVAHFMKVSHQSVCNWKKNSIASSPILFNQTIDFISCLSQETII